MARTQTLLRHLTSSGKGGVALIVGAGPGISASCARLFSREGFKVALAARRPQKPELQRLVTDFDAKTFACDCADST